jgi:hypothetical protein
MSVSIWHWQLRCAGILLATTCAACHGETREPSLDAEIFEPSLEEPMRPGPQPEIVEMLRESLSATRHPADGGGRAWLEQAPGDPQVAIAGTPGRFTLVFEVGPEGISTDGMIQLLVSPFWGWSTPQVEIPELYGYTTVTPSADDIELEVTTLDEQLLGMRVVGRALRPGEQIRLVYGAGPAGAVADQVAEKNSRFWFGVDGDGDGVRAFLPDSPGIDVISAPPSRLQITVPSVARPGKTVRVTIAMLDDLGSAGFPFEGNVELSSVATGQEPELRLPQHVTLVAKDAGKKTLEVLARGTGVVRLRAEAAGGLVGYSNPLLISTDAPRIFWGDLHGHSSLSDGTGTVEDYYRYARDVAALDVAALTDHDHWSVLPLDGRPEMWELIQAETLRFHQPGRFVTLLGYEWTSWIYGHRHVLYFEDEGNLYSSISLDYESPTQLWNALRGTRAITLAHHSAGGPIPTNWEIPPDPVLEPLTEIVSVHGSSEALDSPDPIYDPLPGNYVRDVLERGYRFGFVGSGDSHDGHPGLAQFASGAASGGLAAIISDELTRESVLEAMRERRVYATNGPRILLRTALGAYPMGSSIPKSGETGYTGELFVMISAATPLDRLDLVRSGQPVDSMSIDGELEVTLHRTIENLASGEYVYVRAIQQDGGAAWSSPIYAE